MQEQLPSMGQVRDGDVGAANVFWLRLSVMYALATFIVGVKISTSEHLTQPTARSRPRLHSTRG